MKIKLLIIALLVGIASCNDNAHRAAPTVDSAFLNRAAKINLDDTVARIKPGAYNIDSMVGYIKKLGRIRQLKDSAKDVYILYAQGSRTYADYQKAFWIYQQYFKKVYQPASDSLDAFNRRNGK